MDPGILCSYQHSFGFRRAGELGLKLQIRRYALGKAVGSDIGPEGGVVTNLLGSSQGLDM